MIDAEIVAAEPTPVEADEHIAAQPVQAVKATVHVPVKTGSERQKFRSRGQCRSEPYKKQQPRQAATVKKAENRAQQGAPSILMCLTICRC